MQVFKDKAFTPLLQQVLQLTIPIQQQGILFNEVISFFQYVDAGIGTIRHKSTGRDYNLKSQESEQVFGTTLTQLLYKILNKCCYHMSSKYKVIF